MHSKIITFSLAFLIFIVTYFVMYVAIGVIFWFIFTNFPVNEYTTTSFDGIVLHEWAASIPEILLYAASLFIAFVFAFRTKKILYICIFLIFSIGIGIGLNVKTINENTAVWKTAIAITKGYQNYEYIQESRILPEGWGRTTERFISFYIPDKPNSEIDKELAPMSQSIRAIHSNDLTISPKIGDTSLAEFDPVNNRIRVIMRIQ